MDGLDALVVTVPADVSLTFTAHNIALPDGSRTLRGAELVADSGIARASLRDLELAFPDVSRESVQVADLGCLEGGYAAAFAVAGYNVTGIEARIENILCCKYIEDQLALPNLRFEKADVREAMARPVEWDAVFCCGLLYHLDNPVAFLHRLGQVTRRLLIVQTHYSTRPQTVHEGHEGHWYEEGTGRWEAWQNSRSFWLTRSDLLAVIRESGFNLVFEQVDYLDDILSGTGEHPGTDARSMFVGLKLPRTLS